MAVLLRSQLTLWMEKFEEVERHCPWPGPRPLTAHDSGLLIGREKAFSQFMALGRQHQLLLLYGESGVGKSSLLDALIVPGLVEEGYFVAVCRDWGGEGNDAGEYIARNLHRSMDSLDQERYTPGASLFEELNLDFGDRCAVIFDQFEELIRYNPDLLQKVIGLILRLTETTSMRIILSFRSEYLHALRDLENRAPAFKLARFVLLPVESDWGFEIAKSGNTKLDDQEAIDDVAAERVAQYWKDARGADGSIESGTVRIGLLHLQGLLYVLDDRKRRAGSGTVSEGDVDSYVREIRERRGHEPSGTDLLRDALTDSVAIKLRRAREAAEFADIDPFLIEGTVHHLAQAVSHLSSGGYKLVRSLPELAKATLRNESETLDSGIVAHEVMRQELKAAHLHEGAATRAALVAALSDDLLVTAASPEESVSLGICTDRVTIAQRADALLQAALGGTKAPYWLPNLREGVHPSEIMRGTNCVGPMAGQSQAAVFIEEMRRFVFALYWLRQCDVVRVTRPGEGTPMVSLIHDGFGDALESWSEQELRGDLAVALYAITAPTGKAFFWGELDAVRQSQLSGVAGQEPQVHVNLSLQGNSVMFARLQNTVFVNCDFRGSYFHECTFDGVTFLNCRLDGSMLSDCTVLGGSSEVAEFQGQGSNPVAGETSAPIYEVSAGLIGRKAEFLCRYLPGSTAQAEAPDQGDSPANLYSARAGQPAAVRRPEYWDDNSVHGFKPVESGLAILGSRISAMTIRGMKMVGGELMLRSVTGSGLDIVEINDGTRLSIEDSALRSLSLTTTPRGVARDVHVDVRNSVLVQTNFGPGLTGGKCVMKNSIAMQVWNQGAQSQPPFPVQLTECQVLDLVGVDTNGSCKKLDVKDDADNLDPDDSDSVDRLRRASDAMTYRADPWG